MADHDFTVTFQTTEGVVEKHFFRDFEEVLEVRWLLCSHRHTDTLSLSPYSQLSGMKLTEAPSALFCMPNIVHLHLQRNRLCALPSDIARLRKLKMLNVSEAIWISL